MRKTKILLLSVLSLLLVVSSCKKDDPVVEADELISYLESVITPKTLPSYITASDLDAAILASDPYIIDIRSADKWAAGHITGAVNVPGESNLLAYVQENASTIGDRDIVVVCYSGQSAAWGTALLRMAGFSNAKSLKFGMSSWHSTTDSWTGNVSDDYAQSLETSSNAKAEAGSLPEISEGFDTGSDILNARLAKISAEGFGACATTATEAFANKDNWYIINYWPENHYSTGHIPGAVMYEPANDPLTLAKDLLTLPSASDQTVVVYCYTGQTSAFMAAYLRVLGYNAKTLKFGANSMFTSTMPASSWGGVTVTDRTMVVEN